MQGRCQHSLTARQGTYGVVSGAVNYSTACLPCTRGTFSNTTGAGVCPSCPPGYYCPGNATINPQPCPAGMYGASPVPVASLHAEQPGRRAGWHGIGDAVHVVPQLFHEQQSWERSPVCLHVCGSVGRGEQARPAVYAALSCIGSAASVIGSSIFVVAWVRK